MPLKPDFIPISKGKQMFAITSWRDAPPTPSPSSHHPTPRHSPSLAVLRSGREADIPQLHLPAAASAPHPNKDAEASQGGGASKRVGRGKKDRRGAAAVAATAAAEGEPLAGSSTNAGVADSELHHAEAGAPHQHSNELVDYFLHLYIPSKPVTREATSTSAETSGMVPASGVSVIPPSTPTGLSTLVLTRAPVLSIDELTMQLKAQAAPLRIIAVGFPRVMVSKKNATPSTENSVTACGNHNRASPPAVEHKSNGSAAALTVFQTPALLPSNASGNATRLDPLPPSTASAPTTTASEPSDAAAVAGLMPAGVPEDYQLSLLFAEEAEAVKLQEFLKQRYPVISTRLVSRSRAQLNASLVLKGLPSLHKCESILHELQTQLHFPPSYVRLHRSERGVFKNVIFIKYPNRTIAEDSKIALERLYLGPRPLKVEFKKKSKPLSSATPVPDISALASSGELEKLVRELRISTEHEGFSLPRSELSKEQIRLLKQLCQFYAMQLELHPNDSVTVRRVLVAPTSFNKGSAASVPSTSTRPSPALRPQACAGPVPSHPLLPSSTASAAAGASPSKVLSSHSHPATAPTSASGVGPTISPRQRPLEFKLPAGMSNWRDSVPSTPNPNTASLGGGCALSIRRCHGEEGGGPAFPPGRGRPV